jgi:hypothetical protein
MLYKFKSGRISDYVEHGAGKTIKHAVQCDINDLYVVPIPKDHDVVQLED